jgi:hypothetical protein
MASKIISTADRSGIGLGSGCGFRCIGSRTQVPQDNGIEDHLDGGSVWDRGASAAEPRSRRTMASKIISTADRSGIGLRIGMRFGLEGLGGVQTANFAG